MDFDYDLPPLDPDAEFEDGYFGNLPDLPEELREPSKVSATAASSAPLQNVTNTSRIVSDDENIDDAKLKRKRAIPKIDAERLLSENGLPKLRREAPKLKFKGKGNEAKDLRKLLDYYQIWAHGMFPKANFRDAAIRVEKVCHERRLRVALSTWQEENRQKEAELLQRDEPNQDPFVELEREEQEEPEPIQEGPLFSEAVSHPNPRRIVDDDDTDMLALFNKLNPNSKMKRKDAEKYSDANADADADQDMHHDSIPSPPRPRPVKTILDDSDDEQEIIDSAQISAPFSFASDNEETRDDPQDVEDTYGPLRSAVSSSPSRLFDDLVQSRKPAPPAHPSPPPFLDDQDDDAFDVLREAEMQM